jgi:putative sigma-54 modulation protein
MEIKYHGKNYHVGDKLDDVVQKKLGKLEKYFDKETSAIVVCSKVANTEKMEITIISGGHSFRAETSGSSMFKNIDVALGKIERQIVKNRERLRTVIRKEAIEEKKYAYVKPKHVEAEFAAEVKKNKSFPVRTLSDRDAEINLSTLDHDFFVYADEKTKGVKVMYRRPDGHVGVIDLTNASVKK